MTNNFMCYPNWKEKALTFSYDDGNIKDRDLVALFNKYGVKGTFNLNSEIFAENGKPNNISKTEVKELYKGHEVAVHTVTHPRLELLPSNLISQEITEDKANLEALSDTIVQGMAYPFGTYNDNVVDICGKAGIKYSRTVHSTHNFEVTYDWLRLPATCHHADDKLFELAEKFIAGEPLARNGLNTQDGSFMYGDTLTNLEQKRIGSVWRALYQWYLTAMMFGMQPILKFTNM